MKVTEIVDTKQGTNKNGKPYTMTTIKADGKEAKGFDRVAVGDEVELVWNAEYKNYNFKTLHPQEIPSIQVDDKDKMDYLDQIYKNTEEILAILKADTKLPAELNLDEIE